MAGSHAFQRTEGNQEKNPAEMADAPMWEIHKSGSVRGVDVPCNKKETKTEKY